MKQQLVSAHKRMDMAKGARTSTKFLVVLLLIMEFSVCVTFASPADVNIYHDIPGRETIQMDCSKGSHHFGATVRYGQHCGWGFTPNIWGTTKYFCQFAWGTKTRTVRVWYDDKLFSGVSTKTRPCTHCVWRVTRDGFWRMTSDYGAPPALVSGWL